MADLVPLIAIASLALLGAVLLLLWRADGELHRLRESQRQSVQLLKRIDQSQQQVEGRAYLERLLELPPAALPPLGGWAASADLLILVAEHILAHRPRTVVEFGCGATTLVAARALRLAGAGTLISYEHDAVFADVTRWRADRLGVNVDIRVVDLVSADRLGFPGVWYDTGELAQPIDLAIVDGPPAARHAETRGAAGPAILPRLAAGGHLLLDDAARPGERRIAERWRQAYPDLRFAFIETLKGTLIAARA